MRFYVIIILLALFSTNGACADSALPRPSVGVFYFPGWHAGAKGLEHKIPWDPIKKNSDLKPLLGWYDDADSRVVNQQLLWMAKYGIDYVIFDWYWNGSDTFLDHALNAYSLAPARAKVPFSIMWANHDSEPSSRDSFNKMVNFWIESYFFKKEYLRSSSGEPIVFIFSGKNLSAKANAINSSDGELIAIAQELARKAGLPGIKFLAGSGADNEYATKAHGSGIAAYFAYNYQTGPGGRIGNETRGSHSFRELALAYQAHWDWFLQRADLPYVVPVTAGWNRKGWGGSKDILHDNSQSTPKQFEQHLSEALDFLERAEGKAEKKITICCWNEYGEGSVIEPTQKWNFRYLKKIMAISPGHQSFGN